MKNPIDYYEFLESNIRPTRLSGFMKEDKRLVVSSLCIASLKDRLTSPCKHFSSCSEYNSEPYLTDFLDYSYNSMWPLDWRLHLFFLRYIYEREDYIDKQSIGELCAASASQWTYWSKSHYNSIVIMHKDLRLSTIGSKPSNPTVIRKVFFKKIHRKTINMNFLVAYYECIGKGVSEELSGEIKNI